MTVDVATEGRLVDIVAEGFDAGLRLSPHVPRDMIRVVIGRPLTMSVVGSPDYFALHGLPVRLKPTYSTTPSSGGSMCRADDVAPGA